MSFLLYSCLLGGIGVGTTYFKRPYISFHNQADGFAYYLPLRSYLYDQDFDFTNENEAFENTYHTSPYYWQPQTKQNYPVYPYSIGPSMLWSPFLVLFGSDDYAGHMRTPIIEQRPQIIAGFSARNLNALTIGTYFYAILSLLLSFSLLLKLKKKHYLVAFISVLVTALATPFIYYFRYQPLMSHALAAFSVSLFLFLWLLQLNRYPWYRFLYLGAALGLASLIRWQDIILGVVFIIELLVNYKTGVIKRNYSLFLYLSLFFLAIFITFTPQLLVWNAIYGSYITFTHNHGFFTIPFRYLLQFLFSFRHGVITWSPLVGLAIIGLVFGLMKENPSERKMSGKFISASFLGVILLHFVINGSIADWHGSDSFGPRRIVSLFPIFATGIYFLVISLQPLYRKLFIVFLIILGLYNIFFADLFYKNAFDHFAPVSPIKVIGEIKDNYLN